jgi:hypothetical protein
VTVTAVVYCGVAPPAGPAVKVLARTSGTPAYMPTSQPGMVHTSALCG